MKNIAQLQQERADLVAQARYINDKAEAESRSLTESENQEFDGRMDEVDAIQETIQRRQKLDDLKGEMDTVAERRTSFDPVSDVVSPDMATEKPTGTKQYRDAFRSFLKRGYGGLTNAENRALEVGVAAQGGNIVDDDMMQGIVDQADQSSFVRGLSRVFTVNSDLKIPTETTKVAAAIVAEEGAYGETDPAFGQVTLSSYKLATLVKASEELVRDAEFDLGGWLASAFGRAFGFAEDDYFLTGTGSSQPTGVINASGIGAVTAASATAITSDEVIDTLYAMAPEYRNGNMAWFCHNSTVKALRKLKDGNNAYHWVPGFGGAPDSLLGWPIYANSNMPEMTASNKTLAVCNFDYFYIADRGSLVMQRLNELYAGNGYIGFRAYRRFDGALTQGGAAARLIQAAS
jgi:HK97 family phage major capsid protein